MAAKNALNNIEKTRNTSDQISWLEKHRAFVDGMPGFDVAMNFPAFATRQMVTRFIEVYSYYNMARAVPGSFIECGCGSGFFMMALAHFCSIFEGYHYTRKIIGFDTFEGFPAIDEKDKTSKAAHMQVGGLAFDSYDYLSRSIESFNGNRVLGHLPKVTLVKGDISETLAQYLKEHPATIVGMLHLDVDLYKPTRDVIELLRPRMAKGSVIVFDEPNHQDYPGETAAMMETYGLQNLRLQRVETSTMAAYAIVE